MASKPSKEQISVGGAKIDFLKGGSGDPLVILHGAGGNQGWLHYAQKLAEEYTVYAPSHPGYHESERPDWLETIPDMACFYLWFLQEMGLERIRLMGVSMGGWIAAEMAIMCPQVLERLILVGAAGIKPSEGQIEDIFLITPEEVNELLFYDPSQAPEWDQLLGGTPSPEDRLVSEINRETAVRLCWKPYMHDPRLPGLLARVNTPSLIVWGKEDAIVPVKCAAQYHKVLPNSTLKVIDGCGHWPHIEKRDIFLQTATEFLK